MVYPFILFLVLFTSSLIQDAFAFEKKATVLILKGKVSKKTGDTPVWLKQGDTIEEGATVSTREKSAVKILMIDQTQISLGPSSSLLVEAKEEGTSPSSVEVIRGQMRTKVMKDLLQGGENSKIKFIVRTRSATMGVRGTDFETLYNAENQVTSVVTFEGGVAMVKQEIEKESSPMRLQEAEHMLSSDRAVFVTEGNFSSAMPAMTQTTVPTKLSPGQFESLKSSDHLITAGASGGSPEGSKEGRRDLPRFGSPIPPGVDSKSFVGVGSGFERQLASNLGGEAKDIFGIKSPSFERGSPRGDAPPPEGFYDKKTGAYAPPAGTLIDLRSGLFIPPPPGSAFDHNAGVFVPPPVFGGFDPKNGNYVPPAGYQMDPTKGLMPLPEKNPLSMPRTPGAPGAGGLFPGSPPVGLPGSPGAPGVGGPPLPGAPGMPPAGYGDPTRPPLEMGGPRFDYGYPPPPGTPPPYGSTYPPPPGGLPIGQPQYPVADPYCPNCGPLQPPPLLPPPPIPIESASKIRFSIVVE